MSDDESYRGISTTIGDLQIQLDKQRSTVKELQETIMPGYMQTMTAVVMEDVRNHMVNDMKSEIKSELKHEIQDELKRELKYDVKSQIRNELKTEVKDELLTDMKNDVTGLEANKLKSDVVNEVNHEVQRELRSEMKNGLDADFNDELKAVMTDELKSEMISVENIIKYDMEIENDMMTSAFAYMLVERNTRVRSEFTEEAKMMIRKITSVVIDEFWRLKHEAKEKVQVQEAKPLSEETSNTSVEPQSSYSKNNPKKNDILDEDNCTLAHFLNSPSMLCLRILLWVTLFLVYMNWAPMGAHI